VPEAVPKEEVQLVEGMDGLPAKMKGWEADHLGPRKQPVVQVVEVAAVEVVVVELAVVAVVAVAVVVVAVSVLVQDVVMSLAHPRGARHAAREMEGRDGAKIAHRPFPAPSFPPQKHARFIIFSHAPPPRYYEALRSGRASRTYPRSAAAGASTHYSSRGQQLPVAQAISKRATYPFT